MTRGSRTRKSTQKSTRNEALVTSNLRQLLDLSFFSICTVEKMTAVAPASSSVAFVLTPRLQEALSTVKQHCGAGGATKEQQAIVHDLPSSSAPSITLEQVQQLSAAYRQIQAHVQQEPGASSPFHQGYVHELLFGSSLYVPPAVVRPREPAFVAFLARQRVIQERREYEHLVKDLPGSSETHRETETGHCSIQ